MDDETQLMTAKNMDKLSGKGGDSESG